MRILPVTAGVAEIAQQYNAMPASYLEYNLHTVQPALETVKKEFAEALEKHQSQNITLKPQEQPCVEYGNPNAFLIDLEHAIRQLTGTPRPDNEREANQARLQWLVLDVVNHQLAFADAWCARSMTQTNSSRPADATVVGNRSDNDESDLGSEFTQLPLSSQISTQNVSTANAPTVRIEVHQRKLLISVVVAGQLNNPDSQSDTAQEDTR